MRLFVAINFEPDNKDTMLETALRLKKQSVSGNFSKRDNLHLTLAFIGEQATPSAAKRALDSVDFSAFRIKIGGIGMFSGARGATAFLKGEETPELSTLHRAVCEALRQERISFDSKSFKPHITVARELVLPPSFSVLEFNGMVPSVNQEVTAIELMKSERINGLLRYTSIHVREAR